MEEIKVNIMLAVQIRKTSNEYFVVGGNKNLIPVTNNLGFKTHKGSRKPSTVEADKERERVPNGQ
jgi:hypothetical protein